MVRCVYSTVFGEPGTNSDQIGETMGSSLSSPAGRVWGCLPVVGGMMQKTLLAVFVLLFWAIAVAGQTAAPDASQAPANANDLEVKETAVLGCLSSSAGEFAVTDASGKSFRLLGNPGLDPYLGHEVSISGTTSAADADAPITVTEVKDMVNPAAPLPSFSAAHWQASSNKAYGFRFAYPEGFQLLPEAELRKESNFANPDGASSLVSVQIPDSVYAGSNFRGGYFTVLANPNISNAPACSQFGYADPSSVSSRTVDGIQYTQAVDGEGAAGSAYAYYYLHTYQNDLCYEFKFEVAAANTAAYDLPCSIPVLSEANKTDLLDSFLSRVGFFRPTLPSLSERLRRHAPKPVVTAFRPSSEPGEHSLEIKVAWTTQGVDYVHLQFDCVNGLVVTGASDYMECGSSSNRSFPPNGSTTFTVSNPKGKGAIPFVVKLEPFSHGVAYPSQSKTVSVPVNPDPM